MLQSLFRGKTASGEVLAAVLDAFEEAALIVDLISGKIVTCNQALYHLCGRAPHSLEGAGVSELLTGIQAADVSRFEVQDAALRRPSRPDLAVLLESRVLDDEKRWWLIKVKGRDDASEQIQSWQETTLRSLGDMTSLLVAETPEKMFEQAAVNCASLLGLRSCAVYQAMGDSPRLRLAARSGEPLWQPEFLPSTDLIHYKKAGLWTPEKRINTEIQRAARNAGLSVLAVHPLGSDGAVWGLLAAADLDHSADERALKTLSILSAQINAAYENLILVSNLKDQIEKDRSGLAVQDEIIENLKEGVLILTPRLTLAGLNPAAEWMLGYASEEVRGQPVENIVIGSERVIQAMRVATRNIPTHNLGSVSLHRRNGLSFPAHLQVIPVNRGNEILAILVFIEDCSEDEQIRARTEQLEHRAVLGEVSAVFAHEVRNPINNIMTGLQLLGSLLPESAPAQDSIQRMINDCNRINHLMESVLTFSRPDNLKLEEMDVVDFTQRFVSRWQPRFARVNVRPFFHPPQQPLWIQGDARALEQVYTNLVSNALEAMSQTGGTLAINLSKENSPAGIPEVVISISDNGPGIPDDLRDKIFEPFVSNSPRGTGLGLAITKRVIVGHRGAVNVESFPGGTVFTIRIPASNGVSE